MKDYKALYEESQKALKKANKRIAKLEKANEVQLQSHTTKLEKQKEVEMQLRSELKKKDAKRIILTEEESASLLNLLNGTLIQDS